jgi:hypothetical protein
LTNSQPRFYYERFFEELKSLGHEEDPFFTLEDLIKDYNECFPYGFVTASAHYQVERCFEFYPTPHRRRSGVPEGHS